MKHEEQSCEALRSVGGRWCVALAGLGRTAAPATRRNGEGAEAHGHDHGVGGGVADRGVHQDGHRLPEGEPGHDGHVQLRRVVRRSCTQIQGGAPADVFASADGANMQKLVTGGQVTAEPTVFAANQLTIVVKPGNPKSVKSLADLADARRRVALRATTVPCGKYADADRSRRPASRSRRRRSRAAPT